MAPRRPAKRAPAKRAAARAPTTRTRKSSDGWWPPVSVPIAVEGGLQAKSQRGRIGDTWWSQHFIALLEGFGLGSRLQRGKRYARTGQVLAIEVTPGQVKASVQGSRSKPYRVFIETPVLSPLEWDAVEAELAASAAFAAQLLAGEMPDRIEEAFTESSTTLLPASGSDLDSACSCPDWENPCKHIAAVYFLLAESFDRDPFLIFAWRGRSKEELLHGMRARRRGTEATELDEPGTGQVTAPEADRFGWPDIDPDPEPVGGTVDPPGGPIDAPSPWVAAGNLPDIEVREPMADRADLVVRQRDPVQLGEDAAMVVPALAVMYQAIVASAAVAAGSPGGSLEE